MSKKKTKTVKPVRTQRTVEKRFQRTEQKKANYLPWLLPILVITGICFIPMLGNELTNWDDEYYVVQNNLLRGPDWAGIFDVTRPVVSNYHPITVATLALNYQMTQLDPSSYLITNLLFHLANTALVFHFIFLISGRKIWVAAFCALVFGIHPMHVESVAWVSERKDVLYTFFFLLSLIQYWHFLATEKKKHIILALVFFVLSIMSKPAAIILPLILFLLDYWYGQNLKKNFLWKLPFLAIAVVFAVITVNIQSKTAIAGLDFYPLWSRFFFATYTSTVYILRFFVPYPLSTFHPFPSPGNLGWPVLLSPIFSLALLIFVWIKRRNKLIVFTFFFFMINLGLVLQLIPIGGTLVSERYTYVPYIGLAFLFGFMLDKYSNAGNRKLLLGIPAAILLVFAVMTFLRTKVWKNSETLWTNVLKHYPNAAVPRTNRANHLIRASQQAATKEQEKQMLQTALDDCTISIKAKPNHAKGYENRENIYLRLSEFDLALADANMLIKLEPGNRLGYYTKGFCYQEFDKKNNNLQFVDSAILYFDKCLAINPNTDFALNNRGVLKFNRKQQYDDAIADFTKAISINPAGNYFLNRSKCYFRKGDIEKARADARTAIQKNEPVEADYKRYLNL